MSDVRVEAVARYMHDTISDEILWDDRESDIQDLYRERARSFVAVADAVDPLRQGRLSVV